METEAYMVRIDCIKEGYYDEEEDVFIEDVFHYASWEKGSSISDKPDLILTNGGKWRLYPLLFYEWQLCI